MRLHLHASAGLLFAASAVLPFAAPGAALAPPATAQESAPSFGDGIVLRGSSIAMGGVRITSLEAGKILFVDQRGGRQQRSIDDIAAIRFSSLPGLDRAEAACALEQYDRALRCFLEVLLAAETDVQRTWIHARLASLHDLRREFVQAARHLAPVVRHDPSGFWRSRVPLGEVNEASPAAMVEAMHHLHRARAETSDRSMQAMLTGLIRDIQPVHDRVLAAYDGPPLDPEATMSGYAIADIRSGALPFGEAAASDAESPAVAAESSDPAAAEAEVSPPLVPPAAPVIDHAAAEPPTQTPQPGESPGLSNSTLDLSQLTRSDNAAANQAARIDSFLEAGDADQALALCAALAERPGAVELDRFLHQYGRALLAADRPQDAAVMFTRAAILHPHSPYGLESLLETAIIYRDRFRAPRTAARLIDLARRRADAAGREAIAERARALLARLEESP